MTRDQHASPTPDPMRDFLIIVFLLGVLVASPAQQL
jgi:hypothetical protein